jgi:transposase
VLKKSITEHYQDIKDGDLVTLREQLVESYFSEQANGIRNQLAQTIGILANGGFLSQSPWLNLLKIISEACENADPAIKLKGVVLMHNLF